MKVCGVECNGNGIQIFKIFGPLVENQLTQSMFTYYLTTIQHFMICLFMT